MPGSQTTRGGANPCAGGPAPIAFCCHDGIGAPDYIAFAAHNLACTHPCQRFAGHLAALTHDSGPVWDATPFTVMDSHLQPPAGLPAHRGSMAGLNVPLPTLRRHPRGRLRTARGRCGSLFLHRSGLAPPTPCRSPGAPVRKRDARVCTVTQRTDFRDIFCSARPQAAKFGLRLMHRGVFSRSATYSHPKIQAQNWGLFRHSATNPRARHETRRDQLARLTNRSEPNLLRTLGKLEAFGLERQGRNSSCSVRLGT